MNLKKDCKNSKHKETGTRLYTGEEICLDCRHEQRQKAYEKHLETLN